MKNVITCSKTLWNPVGAVTQWFLRLNIHFSSVNVQIPAPNMNTVTVGKSFFGTLNLYLPKNLVRVSGFWLLQCIGTS